MGRANVRADKRVSMVKRQQALARPELSLAPKPAPLSQAAIDAAIAAGHFHKLPPAKARGHRRLHG